jgi:hypothetical protein
MKTAQQVKNDAIDRVAQGREEYIAKAVTAAKRYLLRNSTINSSIIRNLAPIPSGVEPRVLGAVLRRVIKESNLRLLEYRATSDRRSHCRPIAIWGKNDA